MILFSKIHPFNYNSKERLYGLFHLYFYFKYSRGAELQIYLCKNSSCGKRTQRWFFWSKSNKRTISSIGLVFSMNRAVVYLHVLVLGLQSAGTHRGAANPNTLLSESLFSISSFWSCHNCEYGFGKTIFHDCTGGDRGMKVHSKGAYRIWILLLTNIKMTKIRKVINAKKSQSYGHFP